MYDVIIVGAGPAGSAAGHYLARQGLEVLLLDKFDFPRDKTCGDALMPRALAVLKDMGLLEDLLRSGCRVDGLEIFAPSGQSTMAAIRGGAGQPEYALVVPRLTLDQVIRERALASGAKFQSPIHVTGVERSAAGVVVTGAGGGQSISIKGRTAIIATGASVRLLLQMGLLRETPPMMLAARAYFEGIGGLSHNLQFYFDGMPLPGYGWLFPVAASSANVGAGFLPSRQAARKGTRTAGSAFNGFIQTPPLRQILAQANRVGPVKGYPLRVDFATAPTFSESLLLVGEAAGLVNPLTGEGIDYGLESGKMAAEHLLGLFNSGDLSPQGVGEYDRLLRERFQRLFIFCTRVRDLFLRPLFLNRLVRAANSQPDLKLLLIDLVLGNQDLAAGLPRKTILKAIVALLR